LQAGAQVTKAAIDFTITFKKVTIVGGHALRLFSYHSMPLLKYPLLWGCSFIKIE
jgi:hypothetical protein